MVLWRTLSRTVTTPCATRVSVPVQESWTSHFVPRTVAALYLPAVRKAPLPSPQSLRVFGFVAAALALALGHFASASTRVRVVIPLACVTLKIPSKNLAVWGAAPALGIEVSSTVPLRVSTIEPTGMPLAASRTTNAELPGSLTFTVPLSALTTTTLLTTGVGAGLVGVGVSCGGPVGPGTTNVTVDGLPTLPRRS